LPAPRSGHHRAGERRRAGAARTSAELAAAALLDHRRLRRARREPRGCGDPRGGRGDRRGGDGRPLRLVPALAVSLLADDRLSRAGRPGERRAREPRARGRTLVHARTAQLGRGAGAARAVDFLEPHRALAEERGLSAFGCSCSHGKPLPATAWPWPPTATSITSRPPRPWRNDRSPPASAPEAS